MKKLPVIAAASALSLSCLTYELYRYVFRRGGSPLLNPILDSKGHERDFYAHRDSAAARLRGLPQERLEIRSVRGETLRGFYFPGAGGGKRIAFLVHGYRSEHADAAGMYYDYYVSRGFDLFCCDNTAAGESGGRAIGFDLYESEDCLRWLSYLRRRFGDDVQIILHGFSMGGATVLQMSSRCPENVRFLVADSAYMDASALLKAKLGPLYSLMRGLNRIIEGYDLAATDVRASLQAARVPILFVHGLEDRTVPPAHAEQLYLLYSGEKDCLFVPEARHVENMHAAPEAYEAKLDRFIEKYISAS